MNRKKKKRERKRERKGVRGGCSARSVQHGEPAYDQCK